MSEEKNDKLLNEQLLCCKQLLEASKRLKVAILSDDQEAIARTVSEKEKLIERLRNIKEVYQQGRTDCQTPIEKRAQSEIRNEINAVLKELLLLEEECEKALSRRCGEVKDKIDQVRKSKAILNKFSFRTNKIHSSAKFIDEEI